MIRDDQPSVKIQLSNTLFSLMRQKPIQKITVNELCQGAKIHRSTFYLHFKDKYELFLFGLNLHFQRLLDQVGTYDPQEFLILFLGFCQEREAILEHIFASDMGEELGGVLHKFLNGYFTQKLYEKSVGGVLLPGPIESVADFYVGGLVNTTLQWMKNGCKIPKERLAACQYRLLKDIW